MQSTFVVRNAYDSSDSTSLFIAEVTEKTKVSSFPPFPAFNSAVRCGEKVDMIGWLSHYGLRRHTLNRQAMSGTRLMHERSTYKGNMRWRMKQKHLKY